MMTEAEACIADLDAALAQYGDTIRLQRLTSGPDGTRIPFEVTCPARVNSFAPQELVVFTGDAPNTRVIISPTPLTQAQWPAPPQKDDRIFIDGREASIEIVAPISVSGQVVRYELQCRQ
jgi:hypothetical protein